MKVTISSSSRDNIDEAYKEESRKIISYLADECCELNWGSGKFGIMGICYDEFEKRGNKINGYTTQKYAFELSDLPNAEHEIFPDTFELKKNLFNDSEFIVCLPGGTGTVSEFFSYLEEIRSNDKNQILVICNFNGWFDKVQMSIEYFVANRFNDESIFNYYKIINSVDEFIEYFEGIKNQFS